MFEKEAKEYVKANNLEWELECHRTSPIGEVNQAFQKGAEFGYNKALKEIWHYPSKGELPNKELEEKPLLVRVRKYTEDYILAYYMLDPYYSKNGKRFYSDTDCEYPINIKNVIAWKQIVLPKEMKEK